ncbi:MAG: phosphoglycerate kinase [Bacteroidia bacterium]|nr:phosphoglycerate kinase [Bacteroidia bacterium]
MAALEDLHIEGKRVLLRVDFNVPLDENFVITDDTRMRAALPTIQYILDHGGSVIIMSHLGRPKKNLLPNGEMDRFRFSLKHLQNHLVDLLGGEVHVKFSNESVGKTAKLMADKMSPGSVILLENTRFYKGETKAYTTFAQALAELGDVYVNDAFGSAHRDHASTSTVAKYFKPEERGFGFLMQAEIDNASKVLNDPEHPVIAITGGAKVSDKLLLLERLIDFADTIIVGGGMAYTFVKAQGGSIGDSICEDDKLDYVLDLLEKAKEKNTTLLLPVDNVAADKFAPDAQTKLVQSNSIPDNWQGLDIGPESIKQFSDAISKAKTIIWNGPMGVFEFEAFATGTSEIAKAVAKATQENGAFSLIGGGDSVSAIKKNGLADQVSFVSTGGGAMLEFLEGKKLPGIASIEG